MDNSPVGENPEIQNDLSKTDPFLINNAKQGWYKVYWAMLFLVLFGCFSFWFQPKIDRAIVVLIPHSESVQEHFLRAQLQLKNLETLKTIKLILGKHKIKPGTYRVLFTNPDDLIKLEMNDRPLPDQLVIKNNQVLEIEVVPKKKE